MVNYTDELRHQVWRNIPRLEFGLKLASKAADIKFACRPLSRLQSYPKALAFPYGPRAATLRYLKAGSSFPDMPLDRNVPSQHAADTDPYITVRPYACNYL